VRHLDVNQNILHFECLLEAEMHPTQRVRLLHQLLKEIDKVGRYSIVHLIEIERVIAGNEKIIADQHRLVVRLNGKGSVAKIAENLLQTMIQTQALFKIRRERIAKELRA
jgi:folylpolyglutamate synthase/dihydropteroate synthase